MRKHSLASTLAKAVCNWKKRDVSQSREYTLRRSNGATVNDYFRIDKEELKNKK